MKPKTKSDSVIANVSHSLLVGLLLGVTSLLVLPAAAIADQQPPLLSNVSSPTVAANLFVVAQHDNLVSIFNPTNGVRLGQPAVGNHPLRIAMNPGGTRAYVSNNGGSTISEINTQDGTVVLPAISVTSAPQELTVDPNGAYLYVVHQAGPEGCPQTLTNTSVVEKIDTALRTVVGTPTTIDGMLAKDVLVTPDSMYVYVANYNAGVVDIIQTSNMMEVAKIMDAPGARRLAITPPGTLSPPLVFVTDFCANPTGTVTVIDTGTRMRAHDDIGVGTNPRGIAITPDGTKTYVTNVGSNNVTVINNTTFAVLKTIPVGPTPWHVTITPDGNWAYVSNSGSNTVSIIQIAADGGQWVKDLTVGDGPFFSVVNPANNKLYVSNSHTGNPPDPGTVSVINLATQKVVATITGVGNGPFDLALSGPQ